MTQSVALTELVKFDDTSFTPKESNVLIEKIISGLNLNASTAAEFRRKMDTLFETTKIIGGKLVYIGRIVCIKLWDFICQNPNMALGTLIGALFGLFLSAVPLIGGILALLSTFLGATIGSYLDQLQKGGTQVDGTLSKVLVGATNATKEFFKLIREILAALKNDFK